MTRRLGMENKEKKLLHLGLGMDLFQTQDYYSIGVKVKRAVEKEFPSTIGDRKNSQHQERWENVPKRPTFDFYSLSLSLPRSFYV